MPTEKSQQFSVYIFGNVKTVSVINLPIHFRYHSPSTRKFTKVEIAAPKLMIRCDSDELFNGVTKNAVKAPCSKKALSFEDSKETELCDWKDLFYYVSIPRWRIKDDLKLFKFDFRVQQLSLQLQFQLVIRTSILLFIL